MSEVAPEPGLERARARVGQSLKEKWRLERLLGVGGMAAVYEAVHRNGKRVAVKMLHTELSTNVEVRTRFLREGYLANAVGHPGAVSVLDDDTSDDGCPFLVMELLEGETIERRWDRKGRKLPTSEVLATANQLLDVLAAAHAKGLVHRDVKPENVFLTRDGQIKVLDFGIAHLRERTATGTATQAGALMGTPAFMSPEQARGRWDEVDARSDVWAVGATMFALASGRLVHEGGTVNEQLLSAMTNPAPPARSIATDLAPEVAEVIDKALAFDRDKRFVDARAMQEAIKRAHAISTSGSMPAAPRMSMADVPIVAMPSQSTTARGTANAPSAAPTSERGPSASKQKSARVVVAAVVGVAALLAIVAFFTRSGHESAPVAASVPTSIVVSATDDASPGEGKLPRPDDSIVLTVPSGTPPAPLPQPSATVAPTATATSSSSPRTTPSATPTTTPPRKGGILDRRH